MSKTAAEEAREVLHHAKGGILFGGGTYPQGCPDPRRKSQGGKDKTDVCKADDVSEICRRTNAFRRSGEGGADQAGGVLKRTRCEEGNLFLPTSLKSIAGGDELSYQPTE